MKMVSPDLALTDLPDTMRLPDGRVAQGDIPIHLAQQAGWMVPIYPDAPADGWARRYATPAWRDNGDGTASAQYVDASPEQQAAEAQAAADAAAQAEIEAAAADLLANGERYVAENEYILLCDMLGQCPGAHVKLGLGALQTLMVSMISAAPARENALFQYLMGLQIALQRLGGVGWWDTCTWHDQAAIVNAAQERHNAIVAVLP